MDLQTIKDQTAMKISNDERVALNPHRKLVKPIQKFLNEDVFNIG